METVLKQNKIEHIQTSFAVTKAKELPAGEFEAILSTEDLDRHGEHVSIKGMIIPKRTIRMYFNHKTSDQTLPIGQWVRIWKSRDGKLMGHGRIDMLNEFEQMIDKKIRLGTIDSISIGFVPKEYDGATETWTKAELAEASVVNEPANPSAVVTQKQLGFSEEEFETSLKAVADELEGDTADPKEEPDTPDDSEDGATDLTEMKAAIEELKSSVGALEAAGKAANESPAIKSLIKVRLAAKQVDKTAEMVNKTIRIKLKETSNV